MDSTSTTASAVELQNALELLQRCLPKSQLEALQASAPQAIYNTWVTVWLMIYQHLHFNSSLQDAVTAFVQLLKALADPKRKRIREETLSPNTGSYSRARTRLKREVAEVAADQVFQSLSPSRSGSRRTFLIDGSSIALQSHEALRQEWVPNHNQHGDGVWPICFLALAFELDTGLAVRPETGMMYGPNAESELEIAKRLLSRIPKQSLLIADRLYDSMLFWWTARGQGFDLLTRLKKNVFEAVMKCDHELIGPGIWKSLWKPTRRYVREHSGIPPEAVMEVYVYEFVGFSGQTLWVMSSQLMTLDEVEQLYARRAEIETDIRNWKVTLSNDALRGKSKDMVLKEIAMSAIAFNLIVQVRVLAAEQGKVPPRRISFKAVAVLIQNLLLVPELDECDAVGILKRFNRVLKYCLQLKLPKRKKRRSYPRTAYSKRSTYPKKVRKLNEGGRK